MSDLADRLAACGTVHHSEWEVVGVNVRSFTPDQWPALVLEAEAHGQAMVAAFREQVAAKMRTLNDEFWSAVAARDIESLPVPTSALTELLVRERAAGELAEHIKCCVGRRVADGPHFCGCACGCEAKCARRKQLEAAAQENK